MDFSSQSHILKTTIFVVFLSLGCYCVSGQPTSGTKVKRGGYGLVPFPRVGRSNSYADTSADVYHETKRQLFAFPRVGRDNRARAEVDTGVMNGLWFGPRLGRLQKRGGIEYAGEGPWAVVSLHDFHYPSVRETDYTPRLGRESEEDLEEEEERAHPIV